MKRMTIMQMMNRKSKIILGGALAVSLVAVAGYQSQNMCTSKTVTTVGTQAENNTVEKSRKADFDKGKFTIVHGKVTDVGSSSLTISVLNLNKDEKKLEETGETKEIEVTDETRIKKGHMWRPPMGMNGQKPDGQPPEGANGQKPDGQPPEGANGQKPDGQPPEKPDGDNNDKNTDSVPNGEPPLIAHDQKPDSSLTLSDISVGDEVVVLYDEDGSLKGIDVKCDSDEQMENMRKHSKNTDEQTEDTEDSEDSEDTENAENTEI